MRALGARLTGFAHTAVLAPRPKVRLRPLSIRRTLAVRFASERTLPVITAIVVLGASLLSFEPAAATGAVGSVEGLGTSPRLAIGGAPAVQLGSIPFEDQLDFASKQADFTTEDLTPIETYADDGTLYKPVAVDTVVPDGSDLLQTYVVQSGDTLTGIASQFGVSMMTLWWANKLTAKDQLHIGQKLVVPPVSGLVVTVKEGDTLDSLAAKYKVDPTEILAVNELDDPNLIIGQTLILPDAAGAPIPTSAPVSRPRSGSSCTSCSGGTYSGGKLSWPVVGGRNYISQYFRYGHYGLDIAANYGSPVIAAADGVVTFSGWKNNGGGYQVWISNGSGLNTTYNHMSGVSVSAGQSVGRGQQVGRIGQSGHATGPHLHFEVWTGSVWNGGYRINPLRYY